MPILILPNKLNHAVGLRGEEECWECRNEWMEVQGGRWGNGCQLSWTLVCLLWSGQLRRQIVNWLGMKESTAERPFGCCWLCPWQNHVGWQLKNLSEMKQPQEVHANGAPLSCWGEKYLNLAMNGPHHFVFGQSFSWLDQTQLVHFIIAMLEQSLFSDWWIANILVYFVAVISTEVHLCYYKKMHVRWGCWMYLFTRIIPNQSGCE